MVKFVGRKRAPSFVKTIKIENKLRWNLPDIASGPQLINKYLVAMTEAAIQLKKIRNKRLLVVFPHPDDESVMTGGLILKSLSLGFEVWVICLTKGEKGKIYVNGKGKSAGEIREGEFGAAMKILGVERYEIWDEEDGKLQTTKGWKKKLKEKIEAVKPGLIVTYDFSGISGHPDHIALSREVKDVAGRTKLWWVSLSGKPKEMMADSRVIDFMVPASLRLNLSVTEAVKKWQAIACHRSQGWASPSWWPLCLGFLLKYRYEEFSIADTGKEYNYKYVKFKF